MPHIVVYDWPGRAPEQKKEVARAVACAIQDSMGVPDVAISVDYVEVEKDAWADEVKAKLITPNLDRLAIASHTKREDW